MSSKDRLPLSLPTTASVIIALLAGLMNAFSLATPWDGQPLWWLQILMLTALAGLLLGEDKPLRAAVLGWLFATAWLTATFGWLYTSMHTYGGLAAPLALLAVLALAGFLALYYAMACALFSYVLRYLWHVDRSFIAIIFASFWLLAELMRTVWFTGFPWGGIGYAHVDGPLAAYAPWGGVYGITLVASATAMLLAQALQQVRTRADGLLPQAPMAALMMVLVIDAGVPWALHRIDMTHQEDPSHSTGILSLALLQGNIPQDEKFIQGSGVAMALQWYGEGLQSRSESLVIAPETALPLLPQDMPEGYWQTLTAHFAQATAGAALIGTPLGNMSEGYTNSVYGLASGQTAPYRYDKHHLVPFGEFIPPLFRWFTNLMNIPLGDFNRGTLGQASFSWQRQRIAPNICYEDLFGEELATRFADARQAPTVFVNLSNLAWFGDGQAIDQHLQISRLRALEFARPMVRATNTGATVVINYKGQVTAALPRSTRGVLHADVEGRQGLTPYAWATARLGLWPWWLFGLVMGLVGLSRRGPRSFLASSVVGTVAR